MMRITSFLALGILAYSAALGAPRPETTTYLDGNLTGVSPNTTGTLLFSDDKAVYFRTGQSTVPVPYASISKAELGATKTHSSAAPPLYKVWSLQKRFTGKTRTQNLTLEFTNDSGEDKTMTLELAQSAAPGVLSQIQSHKNAKSVEWWGDEWWKTTRNRGTWNKTTSTAAR